MGAIKAVLGHLTLIEETRVFRVEHGQYLANQRAR